MTKRFNLSWLLVGLFGCIGTDYLDDPKDPAILTNINAASIEIGETIELEATYYYNMWVEEDADLVWTSSQPTVASVDGNGLVTALTKGQTDIQINNPGEAKTTVSITVVADPNDVSEVLLSVTNSSIDVGESIDIEIEVNRLDGEPYEGVEDTVWTLHDSQIASINQNGVLTGLGDGIVQVTAAVANVSSQPLPIMVGVQGRTGSFVSVGSYKATGIASLQHNGNDLFLYLSEDFETSFALGTFIYLANSTDGTAVRAQGVEIAEIKDNGAKEFNVSQIDPSIQLDDFRYVIILCKPASITFGYADLN
ncbi:Ig-like domain-containing protein [Marinoscillum pacificum]|uniref:Ig-like domain-containing protein n=1 Tax=Marinoscillum pacificum TaxID=392723 RepID=UPI002158495F|nr:Ig-like domain-containing protein [Marinoscillum pacificum]